MIELNYLAVAVAAVAVFVFAAVYYTALARPYAALSPAAAGSSRPTALSMAVELGKSLVVAAAVAGLAGLIGITDPVGAVLLGSSCGSRSRRSCSSARWSTRTCPGSWPRCMRATGSPSS
jgi:hypothetical protein